MKNNINLISIIKEIIAEQNAPQTYKYTRTNPLVIPKDPYVYAYEEPNTIWVKNTKTNIGWINITKGVQDGKDKYKGYENHIITNFGSTLGIPTNSQNLKIQKTTTATNNQSFSNNLSNNFSLINPDMLPSVKPNINPTFSYCYNTKLNPNKSNILNKKYNKSQCAAFVNDFSLDIGPFGSAWLGHDNEELGTRVWSAFEKLPPEKIKDVINLFISINKRGGAKVKGPASDTIMNLVNSIVPETCPIELMLGDIIGIFYPGSSHHEEAFMQAGYKYFWDKNGKIIKIDGNGQPPPGVLRTDIKPGNSITGGKGWGMNTHVGIVGDIQDNIPYIFHNIGIDDVKNIGIIYADPPNHLKGNGRIAWVKRNKIDANIKPTKVTNQPMNIQPIPQLNLTAKLQNNQVTPLPQLNQTAGKLQTNRKK
jgi:hypothetical protein